MDTILQTNETMISCFMDIILQTNETIISSFYLLGVQLQKKSIEILFARTKTEVTLYHVKV